MQWSHCKDEVSDSKVSMDSEIGNVLLQLSLCTMYIIWVLENNS